MKKKLKRYKYIFSTLHHKSSITMSQQSITNNTILCDGITYDKHFPEKWINSHKPNTGPKECFNCSTYGYWRGSFVGYCINCAEYEYNFERGCGMIGKGVELYWIKPEKSAHYTYLKSVSMDNIGNVFLNLDDTYEAFQEMMNTAEELYPPYEYLPDPYSEIDSIS